MLARSLRPLTSRLPFLAACGAALVCLGTSSTPSVARAAVPPPTCAATLDPLPTGAGIVSPCWVDVTPYPFGSDGRAVDASKCKTVDGAPALGCYLAVSSLSFRSWNRGLARTNSIGTGSATPFGVWLYNGSRWYPDPTFPGSRICSGSTVVWAGKLDYWLVGGGRWGSVCRFDGLNFSWQPLALPKATVARGTALDSTIQGGDPGSTGITSGTCSAWNDCWLFGTYGTVVRWNGKVLADASSDPSRQWLGTEFTAAVLRSTAGASTTEGSLVGIAVGSSSFGSAERGGPMPAQPDGTAPAQIYNVSGSGWLSAGLQPPGNALPGDPFRTDLVAVDMDASGAGWMAGNPAGWRIGRGAPAGRTVVNTPEPSPLLPFGVVGCAGPPLDRFSRVGVGPGRSVDSFLWSSIATVPVSHEAIAGGEILPVGSDTGEPVLVHADCSGESSVTRFRVPDPETQGPAASLVPASRGGATSAVAANAGNDAWATTGAGILLGGSPQAPHLYHYTDGQEPRAAAGDDVELRPLDLRVDPPIIIYDPLPPPPPLPPPEITSTTKSLPPAITGIRTKLLVVTKKVPSTVKRGNRTVRIIRFEQKLTLKLSFTVKRTTILGLVASRDGRVVATSKLTRYTPGSGSILLKLDRKRWPKRFAFTTDAPNGVLADPGRVLSGSVSLTATARAIPTRRIASVAFQYASRGTDTWKPIGTATTRPYTVQFDTKTVADGSYDLRVVLTDTTGRTALPPPVRGRKIQNGIAP